MESMAEMFERENVRVVRFEFMAGKKNMRMAQILRTMVQNRKITWSPQAGYLEGAEDDTFAKELARLVKKPMSYGYKFDHESGRHNDRASAVGMGLIFAVPETMPAGKPGPTIIKTPEQKQKEEDEKNQKVSTTLPGVRQDWAAQRGLFGMR
jgi:hypothetical protein